eukprot:g11763.t1
MGGHNNEKIVAAHGVRWDGLSVETEEDDHVGALAVQTQEGRGPPEPLTVMGNCESFQEFLDNNSSPSEEAPTAETAAAPVEMDGENDERMTPNRESGQLSAETKEDQPVAVQAQEGQEAAVVENSVESSLEEERYIVPWKKPWRTHKFLQESLVGAGLAPISEEASTPETAAAPFEVDGENDERMTPNRESDRVLTNTEEELGEPVTLHAQQGQGAAVARDSLEQEPLEDLLQEPFVGIGLAAPSQEAPTPEAAAAPFEMDGENDERMTPNRESGQPSTEAEQYLGVPVTVHTQEGAGAAAVRDSLEQEPLEDLLQEPFAGIGLAAPSLEAPTPEAAAAPFEMDGENDERMTPNRESGQPSTEAEQYLGVPVTVHTQEGAGAAAVRDSLEQEPLEDLLQEPFVGIDMPRLLPGEIEVFVQTSTSDWVMIAIPPTGSVLNLKRVIKDAKDEAHRYKFGETNVYYRRMCNASGNLAFNGGTLDTTYSLTQGDVLVEEKVYNNFILHGKSRRLEIRREGGGLSDRVGDEASQDQVSDKVSDDENALDIRGSHRFSAVDVRRMRESRDLYWKLSKDRRVIFMNHTDKAVYVFVFPKEDFMFPGQERHRGPAAINAAAPTAVGFVELGATIKPTIIKLPGVSTPAASPRNSAAVPPYEVFDMRGNASRGVPYVVATLEGNDVLVWKRADAKGGEQVHIQPRMVSPEVSPIFRKKYKIADDDAALSVVMTSFL